MKRISSSYKTAAFWRRVLLLAVVVLICSVIIGYQIFEAKHGTIRLNLEKAGEQIYLTGHTSQGETIQAIVGSDTPISGDQFSCVSCHRRSRLGTSEGGKQVPPLTATALFNPAEMSVTRGVLPQAFKYSGSTRIPYTDESLAKAIRDGVDPSGRKLDPIMPRYTLSEDAVAALTAYLKSESSSASTPGVTDSTLHFATVVTEGVDPAKRKNMLDILTGYFQDKNADTRHNTKRAKFSAYKMYQVYRKWELHIWELKGEESTWPAQLESYYKNQPVLAMVSGLSASSWWPMHQFCERFEIACLFPNTDTPDLSDNNYFTAYFSKGLALEAQALANHLGNTVDPINKSRVIQIFRDNSSGRTIAKALQDGVTKNENIVLNNVIVDGEQQFTPAFWDDVFKKYDAGILVLWLNKKDFETFGSLKGLPPGISAVYGSASLLDGQTAATPTQAKDKFYLTYPWELPEGKIVRLMRVKSWLNSKQIAFENDNLQANTFFSVQVLGEIIMHLLDNFSSPYIIERVEGMLSSLSVNSIYPHLSLGTGQRFASKGCYIVKVSPDGQLSSVAGLIVP